MELKYGCTQTPTPEDTSLKRPLTVEDGSDGTIKKMAKTSVEHPSDAMVTIFLISMEALKGFRCVYKGFRNSLEGD